MTRSSCWLMLALLAGCGGDATEAPSNPKTATVEAAEVKQVDLPNVVMITVDTTRADRLGAYGYDKALTPTLDKLAEQGRLYERAYSPIPLTIPSHAAMMTGMYPANLGIRNNGSGKLEDEATTLAEILKAKGYLTAGSVAAFVTTRKWGFKQGFDSYFDTVSQGQQQNFWHGERPANEVIDDLLAWKDETTGDQPHFVWAHLYDPHTPFMPPKEWLEKAENRPYDGEIGFMDSQIKRLVDAYEGTNTLFVIAGDHGESLGDHDEITHGLFVYDATQRVPLIISGAGVKTERVNEPTSLVDLMPTVLSALGLEVPAGLDGQVMPGSPARPIYMETYQLAERYSLAPHVAVVSGNHKLIDLPKAEIYDLTADASEQKMVADEALEKELKAALATFGFEPPTVSASEDPEVAMQLAALGYAEGDFDGTVEGLEDPKDHKKLILALQQLDVFRSARKKDEEAKLLALLVQDYPHVPEFSSRYAQHLAQTGEVDRALVLVERELAKRPKNAQLLQTKASFLIQKGKFEEASLIYQKLAERTDYAPGIRSAAVNALLKSNDIDLFNNGVRLGLTYLRDHPNDKRLAGLMGIALAQAGMIGEALPLLDKGATADKPEQSVCYHLAMAKIGASEIAEAERLLLLEVENYPSNLLAWATLGKLRLRNKQFEEAIVATEPLFKANPDDPNAAQIKGQALFSLGRLEESRKVLDAGLAKNPGHSGLLLMDANLLSKEGKMEEGKKRFEEAKAAKAKEEEMMRKLKSEAAAQQSDK